MYRSGASRRAFVGAVTAYGAAAALAPNRALAGVPRLAVGHSGPAIKALQARLQGLGYWCGRVDGEFGERTRQAVVALQKVADLDRDAVVGPATRSALERGVRPTSQRGGNRVEIDKLHQVALIVRAGRVRWTFSTSTGSGDYFDYRGRRLIAETPSGEFTIFRRVAEGWDKGELGALWRPFYFNGGIALHGALEVPPYPVSHGCCRLSVPAQNFLIASGLLFVGERVSVR